MSKEIEKKVEPTPPVVPNAIHALELKLLFSQLANAEKDAHAARLAVEIATLRANAGIAAARAAAGLDDSWLLDTHTFSFVKPNA